jgi:hypothetical protein
VEFLPALLLFGGVYALFGLYPATGITAVEVFRRLVMATGVVYLIPVLSKLAGVGCWTG